MTGHERSGACFIFAGPCCALKALPTRRGPSIYHRLGPIELGPARVIKELPVSNGCLIGGVCNDVFSEVRCIAIFRACFVRTNTLAFVKSCGGLPHSIHRRHTRTDRHSRHFFIFHKSHGGLTALLISPAWSSSHPS